MQSIERLTVSAGRLTTLDRMIDTTRLLQPLQPARSADSGADGETFAELERLRERWVWSFAAMLLLAAFLIVVDFDPAENDWAALAIGLGSTAGAALAYWRLGIRAERTRERRLVITYLAIFIAMAALSVTRGTFQLFLILMAATEIVVLAPTRRFAATAFAGLTATCVAGWVVALRWDPANLGDEFATVVIGGRPLPVHVLAAAFFVIAVIGGALGGRDALVQERTARLVGELRQTQAKVAAQEHEAGIVAERERMAQEIHDTLAQGFMSVVMQGQVARAALDRDRADVVRERLDLIDQVARDNLAEARALVAAFAPADLADAGLAQALHRLGDRWAAETGATITVATEAAGPVGADAEVVLVRAAQEALTNVRRHADATSVAITLTGGGSTETRLTVTDDGVGITDGVAEGFGLAGMRRRVATLGGTLTIARGKPGGTVVTITIPAARSRRSTP